MLFAHNEKSIDLEVKGYSSIRGKLFTIGETDETIRKFETFYK